MVQRCLWQLLALWTLLLTLSDSAEDGTLQDVAEHGFKQTPTAATVGAQPKTGACVKDTTRTCRAWNRGTVVDHVTQCLSGPGSSFLGNAASVNVSSHQAYCSADTSPGTPVGSCICGPGYCADTDKLCHRGTYQVINEIFTISTKSYPQEKLYMTPDGKVKIGIPPDPRAAQWRISVTGKGVKILWTELYSNTIMQEYESCTTMTDAYGLSFTKCVRIVGNVADPRADEMGWYIELFGDKGHPTNPIGRQPQYFVQLRAANSWNMFYVSPLTKEGMACESRGRNCPGDSGAFSFDPPLVGRMDLLLDYAPGTLPPGLQAYVTTCIMAAMLLCCLSCVFTGEQKSGSFLSSFLMIPFKECARSFGFRGQQQI